MKPLGHMVKVLHRYTDQAITAALEEMDLTASQGRVMGYLSFCKDPPCPRDVEEAFRLTHPTVSGILTRLEKKEFITLYPDPADRRCKRIRVLPKGTRCQKTMHNTIRQMEHQLVQGFSEEEKNLFHQFLTRAISNMGGQYCLPQDKEENEE